jgi:ferrous iron transport protein B
MLPAADERLRTTSTTSSASLAPAPSSASASSPSGVSSPNASAGPLGGRDRLPRVALIGNPNTGKTTVFNRLCGTRAKTSNFPGTTTSARIGRATIGSNGAGSNGSNGGLAIGQAQTSIEVVDLPGLYRLSLDTPESNICRSVLQGEGLYRAPDAILVVVDACNLTRNLMLVGELLQFNRPVIVALNMVDLAQKRGLTLDAETIGTEIGCPVIPLVARKGIGFDDLRATLDRLIITGSSAKIPNALPATPDDSAASQEALETWADRVVTKSVGGHSAIGAATDTLTERLDKTFTHPVAGLIVFALVMGALFWTLFALATLPMDLIEAVFAHLGSWVHDVMPDGALRDLVSEGIIGGIAGSVVFLPQICLLFFLISILEDTGYLARAAFVMDRLLCRFGLPGHAFVPLLSAHACALPGIMSARLIPDRRDRLATILVAPLMSCSARLPVYVLLTSMLFVDRPLLAAAAFAALYSLGAIAALLSAFVIRRTLVKGTARPMVLELPSYKMPSFMNAILTAKDQGFAFLKTAGTVIMAICVVMWWLNTYPHSAPPPHVDALRASAAQAEQARDADRAAALTEEADQLEARAAQSNSFAGRIGKTIQPVFAPLGYDWQLTVGVLTSFLAREVFVSTMSVLLGGSSDDVEDLGVIERIRTAARDDGTPLFTPAVSASMLVFFVLAMQCLSTLAVTRVETGSIKWAAVQFAYMSVLAYAGAFVTYQGLRLFGVQ